jgi:hypothetical protein
MRSELTRSMEYFESESRSGRSGPQFVRRCLIFYLAALAFFWAIAITATFERLHLQNKPFSVYSMAFNNAEQRFNDFTDFDPIDERFHTSTGVKGQNYPAPMICVYLLFTRNFHHPLRGFLLLLGALFAMSGIGVAVIGYLSSYNKWLLALASLLTVGIGYPFLFVIERGNMEGVIFGLCAGGMLAFFMRRYLVAGIFIALAASMKIFPIVLLGLLLARKRYREFTWSVLLIVPLQILAFWIIGPTIPEAFADVRRGMGNLSRNYFVAYSSGVMGFDHSLFAMIKQILHVRLREDALDSLLLSITPWYTAFACLGFLALYFFRIRNLPIVNQAMILPILAVMLPYVSFEYTLMSLFLTWTIFILYLARDVSIESEQISSRTAFCILGLLAFLFTPVQYLRGGSQVYGGAFQTAALLALTAMIAMNPMRSTYFEQPDPRR